MIQHLTDSFSVGFNYPIYYLITDRSVNPPTREDFINGNAFRNTANSSSVLVPTQHASNFTSSFPTLTINDRNVTEFTLPRIWLAVPNDVLGQPNNQPNTFRLGQIGGTFSSPSTLLENDINIQPDDISGLSGYTAVPYKLYGFNFGQGNDIQISRI